MEGETMANMVLSVAIAEARVGIAKRKSSSDFDIILAAMQASRSGMCDDPDTQFRGAIGALLEYYGVQSAKAGLILKEVEVLKFLSAAMSGVPVDFSQLPHLKEGEKGLGVAIIWRALLRGDDIEKARREVEGTPEPPPMPDGWAADLAGAWSKFAALAAEHEKELVRSDNIEFQRDWLLGALLKLRLLFRMPHNRDEVKACDAGVEWIVEMLNSVDAEPKTVKPLADEEAACVGAVLDQSVVPDALRRMLAVAVCETMSEVRRILEHGGTTPQ